VNYTKVVHIFQAIRNTNQLNGTSARLLRGRVETYKLSAVYVPIPFNELVDVSILHPLRNQSEPVFVQCHTKQWQDVGMSEVLPSNSLTTEPLHAFIYMGVKVRVKHSRCGWHPDRL
jgi:hypothetical protein